jgi:small subunit ribosomal protein S1
MEQLLQEMGGWKDLRRGELVEGMVMSVSADSILINVGGKSEGVISQGEMLTLTPDERRALCPGATVIAIVVEPETQRSPAMLSLDKARSDVGWKHLQEALEQGRVIEAMITGVNRGGAVLDVAGVQGFIPHSQLAPETRGALQAAEQQGTSEGLPRKTRVKVLELDRSRRRVVLTEKAAWQEERAERKRQAMEELKEGQVVAGKVKSISPFGAFVDIGGVEGLLHISEMSWQSVKSPEDVVKIGEDVQVYVLKVDKETGRISLSLRQIKPHPWDAAASKYEVGQIVKGRVTKLAPFGAFVELEPGLEGLVHISELSSKPITHPHQVVKEGDVCVARILRVDAERRRLGLSVKQAEDEFGQEASRGSNEAVSSG